jgi:hypothetical protein
MAGLKFEIARFHVPLLGREDNDSRYGFVVEARDRTVSLYADEYIGHRHMANRFALQNVVGGGFIWVTQDNELAVADFSSNFGAIPTEAALEFGRLAVPLLEHQGIKVAGIFTNRRPFPINGFWRDHGYHADLWRG